VPQPTISYSDDSYNSTLNTGDSITNTLTITNTGKSRLDYNILVPVSNQWLTVTPRTGTLTSDSTIDIIIKFSASAMIYSGKFIDSIRVSHNASNFANPIVIRCTLDVISNIPALVNYAPDPTSDRKPVLNWHNVASAESYTIQISTTSDFASPLLVQPTVDTFYVPVVNLPVSVIYWRVKSDLNVTYSLSDNFLIQSDSIPTIILMNPDTIQNRRPVLSWKSAKGATVYQIQIDTTGSFVTPWLSAPVGDTFFVPPVNLPLSKICWRVSNTDYNSTAYSATDTFWVKTSVAAENAISLPTSFELGDAVPNPFNPSTTIWFSVPSGKGSLSHNISIKIYDLKGRTIRTLLNGSLAAGRHSVEFDGRNENGGNLTSGIYLCKMESGSFRKTVKLIMMK